MVWSYTYLFDLRMVCLKSRKQELKALSSVFTKADSGVVEKAVKASSSLTGIAVCADEQSLRRPYPPPKTEEAKIKVAAIREKLAEVEALEKTGKYQRGLELADKAKEEADATDYKPVQSESLYWVGKLLERVGKYQRRSGDSQAANGIFLARWSGRGYVRHRRGSQAVRYPPKAPWRRRKPSATIQK